MYGVRRASEGRSGRSPAGILLWPLALLPARQATSVDDALGMQRRRFAYQLVGLAATIAAVVVLGVLASQAYDIREPVPGSRQLAGHSIIPSDCWSTALGGVWKFDDNLRVLHDAGMAQIAVGTYPWGILAPLALGLLLMSGDRRERTTGRLAVAWAALAWLCTALFLRKVGFTIYAGFPAMALGIGVWLDGVLRVTPADVTAGGPDASRGAGARVLALLFFAPYVVGAVFSRVSLGGLADRRGRAPVSAIALVGHVGAFGLLAIASGPLHLALVGIVYGVCHGLYYPAMQALVVERAGGTRRTAVAAAVLAHGRGDRRGRRARPG